MTDNSVSQAGVEALFTVNPGARVSQAGVETLFAVTPGAKASQAGVEVLHKVLAPFNISQAGVEVLYKAVPCSTQWAQAWTIIRLDGTEHRLIAHDKDVTWRGQTYSACGGFLPSASESAAEIGSAGNQEIAGLFSTEAGGITATDLEAGRFDGARVWSWSIPTDGSSDPPRALLKGTLGKVTRRPTGFTTELLGDGALMQQRPLMRVLKPDCDHEFGGFGCFKDLGPLTVTGTVDVGGVRTFSDAARTETAGYFRRGRVTFTSGDNTGLSAEIKDHAEGGIFELWPKLPFVISAGDEYSMTPGCTNLKTADGGCNGCIAWANTVNYGGFDSVPGGDALVSTSGVRSS